MKQSTFILMVLFCIFNLLDIVQSWYYIDYLHTPNIFETNPRYLVIGWVGLLFLKVITNILVILYAAYYRANVVFVNTAISLLTVYIFYVIISNEWVRFHATH